MGRAMLHIAKNTSEPTGAKVDRSGEKGGVGGQSMQADNTRRVSSMHLEDPSKGKAMNADVIKTARTRNKGGRQPRSSRESTFLPLSAIRGQASTLLGLACMFAWMELLFCFEGVLRDQVEYFICAELYISRNTANAHRRAIYSKLGIHSQQELLDIVEDGLGGDSEAAGDEYRKQSIQPR